MEAPAYLSMAYNELPHTVEEIFKDLSARRDSILRALTTDIDEFHSLCDPDKKDMCLYGHRTRWQVTFPNDEVPPGCPEPVIGINFARDSMTRSDWIAMIAAHSDSWLLSLAFFFGCQLNRNDRDRLFSLINELPTVFEVVIDKRLLKGSTEKSSDSQTKTDSRLNYVYGRPVCSSCAGNDINPDEIWISCGICERLFHGKCVQIKTKMAEYISKYKCAECCIKKLSWMQG